MKKYIFISALLSAFTLMRTAAEQAPQRALLIAVNSGALAAVNIHPAFTKDTATVHISSCDQCKTKISHMNTQRLLYASLHGEAAQPVLEKPSKVTLCPAMYLQPIAPQQPVASSSMQLD